MVGTWECKGCAGPDLLELGLQTFAAGYQDPNSYPLQEQYILLTTEPAIQDKFIHFIVSWEGER